jgi:peptidoglycan endopeptidase LytF
MTYMLQINHYKKNSLEVGSYITIPEKKLVQKTEDGNFYHQVKPKETIYGIITTYDVTLEDLISHNPSLKDGLKEGMELKIPVSKKAKSIVRKEKIVSANDSKLNLVMFLPFEINKEVSSYRKVATDFYLGSRLAIDSIGINNQINIHLVDSGNETEFSEFLSSNDFSRTDLIIGPLKKDEVLRVANHLKNSTIPVISPLSNSNDFENYSNIISTEPLSLFMGERIAKEITDIHTDQKIYLIYGSDDEKKRS